MNVAVRLDRLRTALDVAGCDAVVVTSPTNIRYLTGFSGSAGMLAVTPEQALLTTDGRYGQQADEQIGGAGVTAAIAVGLVPEQHAALSGALPSAGIRRVALEAAHVTWATQRQLAEGPLSHCQLVPALDLVEGLRRTKDDGELARMTAAASIADAALAEVQAMLADAPTERAFALELDTTMHRLGATGPAFDTIVAAGPNGAKPHHRPSDRPIAPGDLVVIDFGATVDGYRSDMTRTRCVGQPSTTAQRMYEVVLDAQRLGCQQVRAGAMARHVDDACRRRIAEAGWADAFLHGTGHAIGLDVHEQPILNQLATASLTWHSVVTVEPGVYLPEHGGVRIEDTVVITDSTCSALTLAPKDLVI